MPRSSAICGALTYDTGSSRDRAEAALEQRQREDARVVVGDLALVLDLEAVRQLPAERREHAAEVLGQGQERAHRLGRLGGRRR